MIIRDTDHNVVYENGSESKDETLTEMLKKKISFKKIRLNYFDFPSRKELEVDFSGAELYHCNFRSVKLYYTSFQGSRCIRNNFTNAELRYCNLDRADIRKSDFTNTTFHNCTTYCANIKGAKLQNTSLPWNSHEFIAEALRQAADNDVEKLKIAGYIAINTDKCWSDFLAIDDPLKEWAISVLRSYPNYPEGNYNVF
jgi:uncharacterized protein YjbI with pentapeptide repeats